MTVYRFTAWAVRSSSVFAPSLTPTHPIEFQNFWNSHNICLLAEGRCCTASLTDSYAVNFWSRRLGIWNGSQYRLQF